MGYCKNCGREYDAEAESCCPACGAPASHCGESAVKTPPAAGTDLARYAELMDDETLFYAAVCRKEGIGMEQDLAQAKTLFHALALRGNLDGMYQYACLCLGDKFSEKFAVHWLGVAAGKGHISSRLKLAELAKEGRVGIEGGLSGEMFSMEEKPGKIDQPEGEDAFRALVKRGLPNVAAVFSAHGAVNTIGAGFLIAGGLVITNAHVVGMDSCGVTVRFEPALDPKTYSMHIAGLFPQFDIAVLAFKGAAMEQFSKRQGFLLRTGGVNYGEQVYTVGNPLGLGLSVSKGIVSCPARATTYSTAVKEVVQTDITANHGNSGGALLDADNRVIGMVTFVPGASDGGIAMCVPSKYIVEALNLMK